MIGKGFSMSLNGKQRNALAELFNEFRIFQPEVDAMAVADLFYCRLQKPLIVRNARLLCYIMDYMSQQLMIANIWQTIAEENRCFVSVKGKPITRNILSSAKYCAVKFDTIQNKDIIRQYIDIVKGLH